jgi:hypothetical protein
MTHRQRVWEILNLWYKDQYEELRSDHRRRFLEVKQLREQLRKTMRQRDLHRMAANFGQRRIQHLETELATLRNLLNEIFDGNPTIRERYVIERDLEETETERETFESDDSEDLFFVPETRRRLEF